MSSNSTNSLPASPDDNPALAEHANAIRALRSRIVCDVAEIGGRLIEVKRLVGHGHWLPWLDREFGWNEQTALNFMRVHEFVEGLSNSKTILDLVLTLPVSSVYLLAAPSTPQEARDEIIEHAEAGETPPVAEVKRIIERAKGRKPPSSKTGKAGKKSTKPKPRNDIGADSRREAERLRVRVEELQAQVRQRDIKITGLESEIEELRGRLVTGTGGDPASLSAFDAAIKPYEDLVETQKNIIRDLQNENAQLRAEVAALPPPAAGEPPDDLPLPPFPWTAVS